MTRILPFFAQTATATIVIDGVTYRVPLVDAAGHLQVDVVSVDPASGAATAANQATMITALQLLDNLITALAIGGTDQLRTDVISSVLPTLAATSTKQTTMITALQLIDDLQAALESVGTNRLNVNAKAAGASEVKSLYWSATGDTTVRQTVVTPTSGKKIRLLTAVLLNRTTTVANISLYFGTGVNLGADATKAISHARLFHPEALHLPLSWPDGAGPVGGANEVVSARSNVDVGASEVVVLHYREE